MFRVGTHPGSGPGQAPRATGAASCARASQSRGTAHEEFLRRAGFEGPGTASAPACGGAFRALRKDRTHAQVEFEPDSHRRELIRGTARGYATPPSGCEKRFHAASMCAPSRRRHATSTQSVREPNCVGHGKRSRKSPSAAAVWNSRGVPFGPTVARFRVSSCTLRGVQDHRRPSTVLHPCPGSVQSTFRNPSCVPLSARETRR